MKIVPVLLAGGIGERFWPLSRSARPKQLLPLIGEKTMVEETLSRVETFCRAGVRPLIVTGKNIASKIDSTLSGVLEYDMIVEPVGKNTAPAVAAAAAWVRGKYDDALMLVLSADHAISPVKGFVDAVRHGATPAEKDNRLVVFGITPTRPDTGYGYIRLGNSLSKSNNVTSFDVQEFVEKPSRELAKEYVAEGSYLWNSGMFLWKVSTILEEIQTHMPTLYADVEPLFQNDLSAADIDAFYSRCQKESIDYGVLEKSDRVTVVCGTFTWDDIGSWESVQRLTGVNERGTTVSGKQVFEADCENSIIVNSGDSSVAAVGLSNVVVVNTGDAVLVIARDKLPSVKKYLSEMKGGGTIPDSLF